MKKVTVADGKIIAHELIKKISAKVGISIDKFDKLVEVEDGEVSVAIAIYGQVLTKEHIDTIKGMMTRNGLSNVEELVIEGEEDDTKFYSVLKD